MTTGRLVHQMVCTQELFRRVMDILLTPISLSCEQSGASVTFLNMRLTALQGRECTLVSIYDKRESMPQLGHYLRFPHYETNLAMRLKYSVYHSQLCRFARRVNTLSGFIHAAERFFRSMYLHGYQFGPLRSRLYAFHAKFFEITSIPACRSLSPVERRQIWQYVLYRVLGRILEKE